MAACGRDAIVRGARRAVGRARAQPRALPEPIASRVRHGGFVRGAELFDNAAFRRLARRGGGDGPVQRLLLERGYAALHDAR